MLTRTEVEQYIFLLDAKEEDDSTNGNDYAVAEVCEIEEILLDLDKEIKGFATFNDMYHFLIDNSEVLNYAELNSDKFQYSEHILGLELTKQIEGALLTVFTENELNVLRHFDLEYTGQFINIWNPTICFDINIEDQIAKVTATSFVKYCAELDVEHSYINIDLTKKQYSTDFEFAQIEGYEKVEEFVTS